jgi:hypothetical protein
MMSARAAHHPQQLNCPVEMLRKYYDIHIPENGYNITITFQFDFPGVIFSENILSDRQLSFPGNDILLHS